MEGKKGNQFSIETHILDTLCFIILLFFPLLLSAQQKALSSTMYEPEGTPPEKIERYLETWRQVPPALFGSFASLDFRYARDIVPQLKSSMEWNCYGWRGERINNSILLWSSSNVRQIHFVPSDLKGPDGNFIPKDRIKLKYLRYVIANDKTQDPSSAELVSDILETKERFDLASNSTRPLWLSIDIPGELKPGKYYGSVCIVGEGGKNLIFTISLNVSSYILPSPQEWSFHLDLWQNPYSVARFHKVEPWSEAHWTLLKPIIQMLADAGQKCITTTITHDPWLGQTYDPYESMVKWIMKKDGNFSFDYLVFDKYVNFCMNCGIKKQINCYSIIPWGNTIRYFDEKTDEFKYEKTPLGTPAFEKFWTLFLKDFVQHLRGKGWLDKTVIAADEKPVEEMQLALNFLKKVAPELKVALAGNAHTEIQYDVYDYCTTLKSRLNTEVIANRSSRNMPSTFYVCCGPDYPNTFSNSTPAEAVWLGWYAANKGLSGFLRWAYNNWNEDPLKDTRFGDWPSGDCFLVYPGGRSSIRFERLREGIQDYEKVRIMRKVLKEENSKKANEKLEKLEQILSSFDQSNLTRENAREFVNRGKKILEELSSDQK